MPTESLDRAQEKGFRRRWELWSHHMDLMIVATKPKGTKSHPEISLSYFCEVGDIKLRGFD